MRYLSVCSGIEAATAAWHSLGWEPAAFSEIEPFPRAVLAHHYPDVPLHGDFTTIEADQYGSVDLLVGGTPCQSFSVAGLRGGLDDDRGNLALQYLKLADRARPRWLVWENVPGVLSSNGGRDFGSILGGMVELGYGFAYRVLDAQYIRVDSHARAVPQRRRRVFVVGCLGDWRRAAAVLFERESLSGHPAPRREAGQRPAPTISARPTGGGGLGTDFDCDGGLIADTVSRCLNAGAQGRIDAENSRAELRLCGGDGNVAAQLTTGGGKPGQGQPCVAENWAVRRLTPTECERLMGFPDGYTAITYRNKPAADGPRYKALGNSIAVNVIRWIGLRIQMVEEITMDMFDD